MWGCFSVSGTGNLVEVERITKKEIFKDNLELCLRFGGPTKQQHM